MALLDGCLLDEDILVLGGDVTYSLDVSIGRFPLLEVCQVESPRSGDDQLSRGPPIQMN
jgi:hypothetical protein